MRVVSPVGQIILPESGSAVRCTFSKCNSCVAAILPVANNTVSNTSSFFVTLFTIHSTFNLPSSCLVILYNYSIF